MFNQGEFLCDKKEVSEMLNTHFFDIVGVCFIAVETTGTSTFS